MALDLSSLQKAVDSLQRAINVANGDEADKDKVEVVKAGEGEAIATVGDGDETLPIPFCPLITVVQDPAKKHRDRLPWPPV